MQRKLCRIYCMTVFVLLLTMVAWSGWVGFALAQERKTFTYVTNVGDVNEASTPNEGNLHLTGEGRFATADYFRGKFDGDPEDLDEVHGGTTLRLSLELWEGIALTGGSANNVGSDVGAQSRSNDRWFESNNFVGLSFKLPANLLAGATYTVYTAPNDFAATSDEFTFALKWTGKLLGQGLGPQVKLAFPLGDDGLFTELGVQPSTNLFSDAVTLKLPLTLGIGFDNYYGRQAESEVFGQVGLTASLPLKFIPMTYGSWEFNIGGDFIARSSGIRRASTFDRDESTILIGRMGISFTY